MELLWVYFVKEFASTRSLLRIFSGFAFGDHLTFWSNIFFHLTDVIPAHEYSKHTYGICFKGYTTDRVLLSGPTFCLLTCRVNSRSRLSILENKIMVLFGFNFCKVGSDWCCKNVTYTNLQHKIIYFVLYLFARSVVSLIFKGIHFRG